MQHGMPVRHIVSGGLSGSTVFPALSHKGHDFRKKLLIIKCVFLFSVHLLSETFLIIR
jgi:hypothetical protein